MVTDEVWQQLDPAAGRLPRGQFRRVLLRLVALMVAAELGYVAWLAGLLVPRIVHDQAGAQITTAYPGMTYTVTIRNDGWLPAEVVGWGSSRPGLKLVSIPDGFELAPGESRDITVGYLVTDCAALTNDSGQFTVHVARFWGTQSVGIDLPRQTPRDHSGMWSGEPPLDWEFYWATLTCDPDS